MEGLLFLVYIPLTKGILKHAMKPAFAEDLGVLEEAQRYGAKFLVIHISHKIRKFQIYILH